MDFNIRVYKVDREDSNLKGFVSITFDGQFCAKSIALKQSAQGNMYLEMPKYQDYESKEYLPFFSFKNAEFRKALTESVIETYQQIEDKYRDCDSTWGDEEMFYDLSVSPIKGNDTFRAEASMKIQNVFVVHQMHVIQGWNGNTFVGMPQKPNTQKGKKEDIAHAVTADFKKELDEAVMERYSRIQEYQKQALTQKNKNSR